MKFARFHIEIRGGRMISVTSSTFSRNDIGVVTHYGASAVTVAGCSFRYQGRQAIAVRDTVAAASVEDNRISGGQTGVYVRNAGATITGTRIRAVSRHGVTTVGAVVQPVNRVRATLGLLLVTAVTRRGGQYGTIRHPDAGRVPLTSLSRGIVSRDSIDGPR
jgi:hypothetical protein